MFADVVRLVFSYMYRSYVERFVFKMLFTVYCFLVVSVNGIVVLNHIVLVMAARSMRF